MRALLLSQVYTPDTPAVGQHFRDLAVSLAERGHSVQVITSGRTYEAGERIVASSSEDAGVEVRRLPLSSMGKRSLAIRATSACAFLAQAFAHALMADFDVLICSTSPPLSAAVAALVAALRAKPFVYWVMDVNPEQLVALQHASADSPFIRLLRFIDRCALRAANAIVVLDESMRAVVLNKGGLDLSRRLLVIPPWSHEDNLRSPDPMRFRRKHGIERAFVVMYSGNHSPAHPLETVLGAARILAETDPKTVFAFVGGGTSKRLVDESRLRNILSLPYQPLSMTGDSLAAADVHLVVVGNASVGLVHPSKIYAPMMLGISVIAVAPAHAPHAQLIDTYRFGYVVRHGDAMGLAKAISQIALLPANERAEMGARGKRALEQDFGAAKLRRTLVDAIERVAGCIS
jgi:colanic acid biosynthesis glycosyl transferase WcaI